MNSFFLFNHPGSSEKTHARFLCSEREHLPAWAVDIEEIQGDPNAWGMIAHPSDELIHSGSSRRQIDDVRAAWIKLDEAGLLPEARLLMGAARSAAEMSAAEDAAGEDI